MRIPVVLALLGASLAHAAGVFGTLRAKGAVAGGVPFQVVDSAGKIITSGQTDRDGSFRFHIDPNGRFTFRVNYDRQSASAPIFSSPKPAQYDFDLVRQPNGWVLMRR